MPSTRLAVRRTLCGTFLAITLLGMSACTSNRNPSEQPADPAAVPADLRIIFGHEGGFAGRMRGYTVQADGTVEQWEGKSVGEQVLRTATLSPEDLRTLWKQVQAIGFFDRDQQQFGNASEFVNLTAEGRSHRVSWTVPLGEKRSEEPLQQLYTMLEHKVHAAMQP